MKKMIYSLVSIIVLSSCLAACAKTSDSSSTSSPSGTIATNTSTTPIVEKYADKVTYKILMTDVTGLGAPEQDDKILEFLDKKFNVDLQFTPVTSPQQTEIYDKENVLIASNQIPDVMHISNAVPIGQNIYENIAKEGQLVNVEDLVKSSPSRYPNLLKYVSDPAADASRTSDKKLDMLPRYIGAYDHAFFIRQDWLDKLGLKMPTTLDEMYTVLQSFVKNDPDGKKNLGLTMGNTWWLQHIFAGYTSAYGWVYKDGKYTNSWELPAQEDGMKFAHKLMAEGLLDKEIFTQKAYHDDIAKFTSGRVGIFLSSGSLFSQLETDLLKNFPNAKVGIIPADMKGPAGIARLTGNKYYEGEMIYKGAKDPTRLLDMYEYFLSDEGQNLMRNGIEGVHYTKDANGKMVKSEALLKHERWGLVDSKSSTWPWALCLDISSHLNEADLKATLKYPDVYINFIKSLNQLSQENKIVTDALGGRPVAVMKDLGTKPDDTLKKYSAQFLTGDLDITSKWNEFLDAYRKAGLDKIEAEIDSKYKQ